MSGNGIAPDDYRPPDCQPVRHRPACHLGLCRAGAVFVSRLEMMKDWGMAPPMPERVAQMADEINQRKADEWQPPFDEHEYTPEATVPDDWLLREHLARAKAKDAPVTETLADIVKPWYTIETD